MFRPYIYLYTGVFILSTLAVISKHLIGSIDPIFLAFIRTLFGGLIIFVLNAYYFRNKKRTLKLEFKDIIYLLFPALLYATSIGNFQYSLKYINASLAAVIFSTFPIFSVIFYTLIYKQKLKKSKFIGILIGLIGVYIASFGFHYINLKGIKGPFLILISSILFGLYMSISKSYISKYGVGMYSALVFIIGSFMYLPFIRSSYIHMTPEVILSIIYIALIVTGLADFLYLYGIKSVDLASGTSTMYAKPIMASVLAFIFLHEKISLHLVIGGIIIFSSLYLIARQKANLQI